MTTINSTEYKGWTIVEHVHGDRLGRRFTVHSDDSASGDRYATMAAAKGAITRAINGAAKWAEYKARQDAADEAAAVLQASTKRIDDAALCARAPAVKNEDRAQYHADRRQHADVSGRHDDGAAADEAAENATIAAAVRILQRRLIRPGRALTQPDDVRNLIRLELAQEKSEVFCIIWLNTSHQLIAFERLGHGTIDTCAVYRREVIKAALRHNAAAAILVHNHPSGLIEPSNADKTLTIAMRDCLQAIEVRLLDHFIVGGSLITGRILCDSMRETGFHW